MHVVFDLHAGGLERLVADLVQRADPDRFDSHVMALADIGRGADDVEPARVHQAGRSTRWSMIWPAAVIRDLRTLAPDVVHTHSGIWYKASLAARAAGVPRIIHTDHGRLLGESWLGHRLDWMAARRTDVIVAVSDALGALLRSIVPGFADRIRVVLNGVDMQRFAPAGDPGSLRRELGLPRETPIIGSTGRFDPIKGFDVMLRAFAAYRRATQGEQPAVLVIAGEGPEEANLKRLASDLGIGDSVHFVGWRGDVPAMLREFTIFTLTSRSEGTSVSLLEAMASGVCPVVTEVGGNRAVVGPELAHRLVPSEQPDRIAQAWADVLHNQQRRLADGQAARARVQAHYSLDAMVRAYESLYAPR